MCSEHDETDGGLPADLWRQIDRICDEYESQWTSGNTPDLVAYLDRIAEEGRPVLFRELLALEAGYRETRGEALDANAYLERFPGYADAIRQAFDRNMACSADDTAMSIAPAPDTVAGIDASRNAATDGDLSDEAPQFVGKYRVVSLLGRGGQAEVYRAVHPRLNKDVVIKIAKWSLSGDSFRSRQLQTEGRVLAQLEHPNLAKVYDLDFHEGRPYLVMDYVQGRNLRQYVQSCENTRDQRLQILSAICRAVSRAHRSGVTHLDIKPENIIVDDTGKPWLIDFGLAQFESIWSSEQRESGVAGTPAYMPPEQAAGKRVDHRSDVFSLGGVLYFLLIGRAPFEARTVSDSVSRARDCDFDAAALNSPDVPAGLARICLKALDRDPQQRFASAHDLARALEGCARRTTLRRRVKRGLIAVTALVLLAAPVWYWREFAREAARPEWDREARELRLDGQVVRRVRSLSQGTNIVPVLDAFQKEGWPTKIASPFGPQLDPHRLNDAVRSLNVDLKLMRFLVDAEGEEIRWERTGSE